MGWEISSSNITHYHIGVGELQLLAVAVVFKGLLKSDCEMLKCMQCACALLRRRPLSAHCCEQGGNVVNYTLFP